MQDAAGVRVVSDGGVVHPGDTLQVTVTSATDVWVTVLSIDGAQRRSRYVPTDGGMVRVERGSRVPLPQSTILDDVLGPEAVAVFLCARQLADPSTLAGQIRDGEPPAGCEVHRFQLEKRAP